MIALALPLRAAHLAAIGAAGSVLRLYTGPQPAAGAVITGQVLLAQFAIIGWAVDDDTLSLSLGSASGLADGDAVWGRVSSSDGEFVLDGDVGTVGSTALIQLRSIAVTTGTQIAVTAATLTYA